MTINSLSMFETRKLRKLSFIRRTYVIILKMYTSMSVLINHDWFLLKDYVLIVYHFNASHFPRWEVRKVNTFHIIKCGKVSLSAFCNPESVNFLCFWFLRISPPNLGLICLIFTFPILEKVHFPSFETRNVFTFHVLQPGKWALSQFWNPESV